MFVSFTRFSVPKGIVSLIGSGGKTSFLRWLSTTLDGKIILTTSTHIHPFEGIPLIETKEEADPGMIRDILHACSVLCLGSPSEPGKLSSPRCSFETLTSLADYVLVEADGSRGLPLKAHRAHEPAIPEGSAMTICVAGLSGLGQPIKTSCHCPDLYADLIGKDKSAIVTPEMFAQSLNTEALGDVYFINQTDLPDGEANARRICDLLAKPAFAGSLKEKSFLL
ncbi:MAG: putative selenium-dependent hydroxylase accessory protein YqeC [Solobacterium sp.]|nr:putative selenium-dependent hydroxylase accessory protein YqeC [Solobacterium sp.]